jgi:hypothetical protein
MKTITVSLIDHKNTYNDVEDIGETISCFIDEAEVLCETNSPACGYYDSGDELLFEVMEPIIKNALANMVIELHDGNKVQNIDGTQYYDYVWDYFYGGEGSYCKAASLMCEGIENFLREGTWHIGMIKGNFEDGNVEFQENVYDEKDTDTRPAMYFGFDEPLELWTIDPNANKEDEEFEDGISSWDNNLEVDEILGDDPSGCISTWAVECGIYYPKRSDSFEKCPIGINKNMSYEEIRAAIVKYLSTI